MNYQTTKNPDLTPRCCLLCAAILYGLQEWNQHQTVMHQITTKTRRIKPMESKAPELFPLKDYEESKH